MEFLEKNWPVILVIWLIFLTTALTIKMVFWSSSDPAADSFSVEELMRGVAQNDSRLLEYIHSQMYSPPRVEPIMQATPVGIGGTEAIQVIKHQVTRDVIKFLRKKHNGFFLECRGYDGGDRFSKTRDLELYYNWTGILMEPDPFLFPKLIATKRNAWLLNACLSPDPTPHNLDFLRKIPPSSIDETAIAGQKSSPPHNKFVYRDKKQQKWTKMRVSCFPLFSVVSAIGVKNIDFLILDTQGLELQILLNVPWQEIHINVISVNVQSVPEGPDGVKYFMSSKQFNLLSTNGYFHTFVNNNLTTDPKPCVVSAGNCKN